MKTTDTPALRELTAEQLSRASGGANCSNNLKQIGLALHN